MKCLFLDTQLLPTYIMNTSRTADVQMLDVIGFNKKTPTPVYSEGPGITFCDVAFFLGGDVAVVTHFVIAFIP